MDKCICIVNLFKYNRAWSYLASYQSDRNSLNFHTSPQPQSFQTMLSWRWLSTSTDHLFTRFTNVSFTFSGRKLPVLPWTDIVRLKRMDNFLSFIKPGGSGFNHIMELRKYSIFPKYNFRTVTSRVFTMDPSNSTQRYAIIFLFKVRSSNKINDAIDISQIETGPRDSRSWSSLHTIIGIDTLSLFCYICLSEYEQFTDCYLIIRYC